MVLVGVLFNVALGTITDLFTQEAGYDLQVAPAAGVTNITNLSYVDVDQVSRALRDGGAEEVHPLVAQAVLGFERTANPLNGSFLVLYGAEEGYDVGTEQELEGRYELDGPSCVVSSEAAQDMEVGLGDTIQVIGYRGALNFTANLTELLSDPEFLDRLVVENWTVEGIIDVRGRFLQGIRSYVIKDIATVQGMYDIEGQATYVLGTVDQGLYDLNDPEDPAEEVFDLAEDVALRLGPDFAVRAPKAQAIEASLEASRATNVIAYLFSIVFPIISGIMIASILNLSVEERAKDLATMRLLGARRRLVGRVVGGELALMLVVGIPIGIALGVGLPAIAHAMGAEELPEDFSQVVDWGVVVGQVVITLLITSLFALAPLRKAMATTPAEAISQVRSEGRYRYVTAKGVDKRLLLAAFLLFLALLYATFFIPYFLMFRADQFFTFFILSFLVILLSYCIWLLVAVPLMQRGLVWLLRPFLRRTHKLVRANLDRYVRRNASTTLIFTIIVAILLFFSSFFAAIQDSVERQTLYELGSDILVSAEEGLPEELVEGLADANFTEAAAAATPDLEGRLSDVVYSAGARVDVLAVWGDLRKATFVSRDDVYRGDLATIDAVGDDGCVVSRGLATALEVGLGDTVSLEYGEHRLFLKVRLVLKSMPGFASDFQDEVEYADGQGVMVSLATYSLLAGVEEGNLSYSRVFIMVEAGQDHEEVGRTLQQRYRVYFTFVALVAESIIQQAEEGLRVLNTLFFVILMILMLVAFFSLYMNLLASILEREFELGIIRSLGLRSGAMRNALITEGVATALVAMMAGVVVGMTLSALIISFFNMLSPVDFVYSVPWTTLLVLLVLTLFLAIAATYPPAKRVAKRPVVELMRRAS